MKRMLGLGVLLPALAALFVAAGGAGGQDDKVVKLFNGKDLSGFYTFNKARGKNTDPEKVFTVHDGMIHLSGKEFGALITDKEYDNYHLLVEFKWGDKTWPPREAKARDSGILLHCVGE